MNGKPLRRILLAKWFFVPASIALLFTAGVLFLSLFRPYLDYQVGAVGSFRSRRSGVP